VIRIRKPAIGPGILASEGRPEMNRHCFAYEADSDSYDRGTAQFTFDSKIYGHSSVKKMLIEAQHGKCCFCESKITHVQYGDVEHFRPKAGYRQHPEDPLGRPGYYWLAYEWRNLYLACQLCNQRFKRNMFPLKDATHRCLNHRGDLTKEQPLFIDPGIMDPEAHIEFSREQVKARNGSLEGKATIFGLDLEREPLRERRSDWYQALKRIKQIALGHPDPEERQEARAFLDEMSKDTAEYSSMVRCLMRQT
jgi:uncharacterized protein (TIGR02646 family)